MVRVVSLVVWTGQLSFGIRTMAKNCVPFPDRPAGLRRAGLRPSPLVGMVRLSPVVVAQLSNFGMCNQVKAYLPSRGIPNQLSASPLARIGTCWLVVVLTRL